MSKGTEQRVCIDVGEKVGNTATEIFRLMKIAFIDTTMSSA